MKGKETAKWSGSQKADKRQARKQKIQDAFTDTVYTREPYNQRGDRGTRNDNDGLFRDGGELLMLNVIEDGEGYAAVFDIGLQMG